MMDLLRIHIFLNVKLMVIKTDMHMHFVNNFSSTSVTTWMFPKWPPSGDNFKWIFTIWQRQSGGNIFLSLENTSEQRPED